MNYLFYACLCHWICYIGVSCIIWSICKSRRNFISGCPYTQSIHGLIIGAMLPYWFSAMTMKSVGSATFKMVEEVRRQFKNIPDLKEGTAKPDYATCVKISTDASLK